MQPTPSLSESPPLGAPAIALLTDDILYAIFELLRSWMCFPGESDDVTYDLLENDPRSTGDALGAEMPLWTIPIVLSHICARWRAFALATPRLWRFIRVTGTFPNRVMINNFLERAQGSSLSILFTKPTLPGESDDAPNYVYNLIAVASEIADLNHRVEELGVVLRLSDARVVLQALKDSPLSHLQKLWLYANREDDSNYSPISLFNVNPLSVRTLHARHVPIVWLPFEGLVRLEISAGPAPSLPALLYSLKSSPRLEVLMLRMPCRTTNEALERSPVIELAHLRELLLSVDRENGAAFSILPYISFPTSTEIELRFAGGLHSRLDEECPSLRQVAAAVEHMEFYADPAHGVTLESAEPCLTLHYDCTLFRSSHQILNYIGTHFPRACDGFLTIPFPALAHLSLSVQRWMYGPPIAQAQLDALFFAVPTVTQISLDLHPMYTENIAAALGGHQGEGEGEGDSDSEAEGEGENDARSVPCPKLRKWTLVWSGRQPSVDDFWWVERCCAARAQAGVPIEQLETSVEVPDLVLAVLRRSVGTISVVDGYW